MSMGLDEKETMTLDCTLEEMAQSGLNLTQMKRRLK